MINYIGIDIGGTSIRVGGIDEKERITFEYKEPTFKNVNNADDLCLKIKKMIEKVPNYKKVKAIGIGFPGSIDLKTERVVFSDNIGIFENYPLLEKLRKEFNKPFYIENDARVAAFAESIIGAGKNYNSVCYVTISTGLGGGLVIDKNIYKGSTNLGSYFSRMILDGQNTSDYLISGTGLMREAKEKIGKEFKTAEEVFKLAESGNETAKSIVENFKIYLVALLLNISCIINPEIIVLGGGVIKSKEYFLDDVKERFKNKAEPLVKDTIIDVAKCKEPGIIGAALLAKEKSSK